MIDSEQEHRELSPIEREAHAWVRRLTSGEASAEDGAALQRWCSLSPAHAAAFCEASQFWNAFGPAGQGLREQDSRGRENARDAARRSVRAGVVVGRRTLLAGGLAASAAAAMVIRPPLRLWPSLSELRADYRTGTGEQRQIAMSDGVSVRLNSQTSLSIASGRNADAVELVAGEASFQTGGLNSAPFSVVARGGRTSAISANFEVRLIGTSACVTCLANDVQVDFRGQQVTLRERQQVTYGDQGLAGVLTIDPAVVAAWQRGLIIFNMMPLADVIDELNRYRPGRIVLLNTRLARSPVNGRFKIDDPDEALVQIERAFGVHRRTLPGGLVLLT